MFRCSFGILNISANEFPKTRPNDNNGSTKVEVSLYVIDIENVDNKNQSFTADVVVRLKWKDEGLAGTKGPIPLNSIWNPNIQIYNLRNFETHFPLAVKVSNDGWVQYTQRYYTTMSSPLDFTEFPFDQQKLPISLLAFGFTPDQVEMVFETLVQICLMMVQKKLYVLPSHSMTSVLSISMSE